ncbi:MAG: hypothetical protein ACLQJR_00925 [Stellaceae bacterium]
MANASDVLRLLGEKAGRYLLLDRAHPRGWLKGDLVTLKEPDGRDVELVYPSGYRCSPLVLPSAKLHDFLRVGFIRQDSDDGAEAIFRLTRYGLERARSIAA